MKTRDIHCALDVCFSFLAILLNYILYPYCAAYWKIEQVYPYQRTESMSNFSDLKIWRDVEMRCPSKIQRMKANILPKGACTCRKFTSTLILRYLWFNLFDFHFIYFYFSSFFCECHVPLSHKLMYFRNWRRIKQSLSIRDGRTFVQFFSASLARI